MLFDGINWECNSDGSKLGFIDFGKYCATIYVGNEGLTTSAYPFELKTYEKDENSDLFLKQLKDKIDNPLIEIPPECRITILEEFAFLNKQELEEQLNYLYQYNCQEEYNGL